MPYFTIGEDVCAYRRFCNWYSTLHICFLVFVFNSKKWARIHGDLQAINLLQFSPPPTSKNPSCINHHVPIILLSPCSKICTPQLILGFIGYIFASSLGTAFSSRPPWPRQRTASRYVPTPMPAARGPRVSKFQPYRAQIGTSLFVLRLVSLKLSWSLVLESIDEQKLRL